MDQVCISYTQQSRSTTFMKPSVSRVMPMENPEPLLDREWYDAEESQVIDLAQEDQTNLGPHTMNDGPFKRTSLNKALIENDSDKWESNRLRSGGAKVAQKRDLPADYDEDHHASQTHLIYSEKIPKFLASWFPDGKLASLHKSSDPFLPIKNPTSDFALLSRKGSPLVRLLKERKERAKNFKALVGDSQADEDKAKMETFKGTPRPSTLPETSTVSTRQSLPAFACRNEFLRLVRENQVLIVVGETGSGKTTQLSQFLFEDGFGHSGIIGCTQPRRVAAMSVAKRVAEEMNCLVGSTVGYSIRFEDCTSAATKIKYMTDGVLLRETLKDPDVEKYSVIIIDEAHERSLQTDIILGLLKQVLKRRRDLKVIVTSATMNSEKFSHFFGTAPVFTIPGRTYPVNIMYSKSFSDDYVDASIKHAITIHLSQPAGDILIFLTGQEEIDAACEILQQKLDALKEYPAISILPIYSQLPADLQSKIFDRAAQGVRKCIIATNIAETSLTVDGIKYVIDCGFSKIKVYNPRVGMDALQVFPISQAAANQRAGRAGRTGPGICYRLYTETAYKLDLFENNVPEIQRTNLSNVILLLKSLGIEDILGFEFLDPPQKETLIHALHQLWIIGALGEDGSLSELGKEMAEFPLDPPLSKMILVSKNESCLEEITIIVSMLSAPSIFFRPKESAEESDIAREKFYVPESDHLTLLNIYRLCAINNFCEKWCAKNFINNKSINRAREIRRQLLDILKTMGIRLSNTGLNWDPIRKTIASAYVNKVAKVKRLGEYYNLQTGMPCLIHPTSSLFGLGYTPEYIVYHDLVMTSKEYMQCVTAVEPLWIAQACPYLYSLRISEFSPYGMNTKILDYKTEAPHPDMSVSDHINKDSNMNQSSDTDRKLHIKPKIKRRF